MSDKDLNSIIPKGIENIPNELKEVHFTLEGSLFGTSETKDFVKAFYKAWNTIKEMKGFNVLNFIGQLTAPLFSAYMGADVAFAELMDLQDSEIVELVNIANDMNLGEETEKAKQVCKMILYSIQTYAVFKNGR